MIPSVLVPCPNDNGLALAGNENIMFVVYSNAIFGKDGDSSGIGCLTHAHEGVWEFVERVGFGGLCNEP